MNGSQAPVFYKNPGLAAVLSFFWTGLGQIYNGQIGKGIGFMVLYFISWLLIISVIGIVIGIFTTPFLWIYGMYDAYKCAERINWDISQRAGANQSPAMH